MANTAPIPYDFLAIDIPAGETRNIPGQFTWIEILQEFQTAFPLINADAVSVGFYPGQPQRHLVPAITVVLPVGFPSVAAQLVNEDLVNDITVWLITGNGQVPAIDHRLVLPVGSLVDVTVVNTNTNPVPVSLISPNPVPVTSPVEIIGSTGFNVAVTGDIVAAGANLNGIDVVTAQIFATDGGYPILSGGGKALLALGTINGSSNNVVLPRKIRIPAGEAFHFDVGGASAHASGTYELL